MNRLGSTLIAATLLASTLSYAAQPPPPPSARALAARTAANKGAARRNFLKGTIAAGLAIGAVALGTHLMTPAPAAPIKPAPTAPAAPAAKPFSMADLANAPMVYVKPGETPVMQPGVKYAFPMTIYVVPLKGGKSVTAIAQDGKLVTVGDHQPIYKIDSKGHPVPMTVDDAK